MIMPVYNSEEYVAEAIDSVLAQNFDDFELIVVDDGSSDKSGAICDEYGSRDARVKTFHIPNGGMCHARNYGMKHATGKYIGFCDNDDEVLQGLFECIAQLDAETTYTIDCFCFGRYTRRYSQAGELLTESEVKPNKNEQFPHFNKSAYLAWNYGSEGVWCRMYRRDMLAEHNILFDESFRHGGEDAVFNDDVASCLTNATFISKSFYVWKIRATHSTSMAFQYDTFEATVQNYAKHDRLVKKFDLESDKEFLTKHFFEAFIFHILQMQYKEKPRYRDELPLYQLLTRLYEPYIDYIEPSYLSLPEQMAWLLFKKKRYRLLYLLVYCSKIIK